jgi:hypothetical protein
MKHSFKYACVLFLVVIIIIIINCSYKDHFRITLKFSSKNKKQQEYIIPFLDWRNRYAQYEFNPKTGEIFFAHSLNPDYTKIGEATAHGIGTTGRSRAPPQDNKVFARTFTKGKESITILIINNNIYTLTYTGNDVPVVIPPGGGAKWIIPPKPIITYDNNTPKVYIINKSAKTYATLDSTTLLSLPGLVTRDDIIDAYIYNKSLYILLNRLGSRKLYKYTITAAGVVSFEKDMGIEFDEQFFTPDKISLLISKNRDDEEIVYILKKEKFNTYYLQKKKGKGRQNTLKPQASTLKPGKISYIHDITKNNLLRYIVDEKEHTSKTKG